MRAIGRGGVYGKARIVRDRRRSEQEHADRMVYEYLTEPITGPPRRRPARRPVPIRGLREFLPSVAFVGGPNTVRTRSYPSLPEVDPNRKPGRELRVATRGSHTRPSRAPLRPRQTTNRTPRSCDSETFSLGRFLAGCAVGSAAAALVLLVVSQL